MIEVVENYEIADCIVLRFLIFIVTALIIFKSILKVTSVFSQLIANFYLFIFFLMMNL